MRLATYEYQSQVTVGVLSGATIVPIQRLGRFPADMQTLIKAGPTVWKALQYAASTVRDPNLSLPLDAARLLAPLPRPAKNVICLGVNYAAHAQEAAAARGRTADAPTHPVVFTKAPTTVIGPTDPFPYDSEVSTHIDWEVELAVIIGVSGRKISAERALDHVFGYTVLNDITARDLQSNHKQFFIGKSLDGACPMGPVIVTADELPDPQSLRLTTHVNGVLKQDANTADMIFTVASTISILSKSMTLEAGDIISTGTPEGVGFARTPPEYLKPGDVVECMVEGIGTLRTPIVGR